MNDLIVGQRSFTDGTNRDVCLDSDGRQYVLDDDGQRVDGVWIFSKEEYVDPPHIMTAG